MRSPARILVPAAALAALLCSSESGAAQNVVLDEGEFRIFLEGREIGKETFVIRRAGAGEAAEVLAQGVIELNLTEGRRDVRPLVKAVGSDEVVTAYQVDVSGAKTETVRIDLRGSRYVSVRRNEEGERQREYRAPSGTHLLEESVAHHYFFLRDVFARPGSSVMVIRPLVGEQLQVSVNTVGRETLEIAGTPLQARHFTLTNGEETRHVWVDEEGRVLQLEVPASGYRAVRVAPPR